MTRSEEVRSELNELKGKLETNNSDSKKSFTEILESIKILSASVTKNFNEINGKIDTLTADVLELRTSNTNLTLHVDKNVRRIDDEINFLKEDNVKLTDECQTIGNDNALLNKQVYSLETQVVPREGGAFWFESRKKVEFRNKWHSR